MCANKGYIEWHKTVTGSPQIIGSFSSPEVSDFHSDFSTFGKILTNLLNRWLNYYLKFFNKKFLGPSLLFLS